MRYYYHMTSARNLLGIYDEGLQPSREVHWGGMLGEESYGKVFLTTYPENALYYADILHNRDVDEALQTEMMDAEVPYYFLLRVPTTLVPGAVPDPGVNDEFYTEKPILPEFLHVLWAEHGWKPLLSIDRDAVAGVQVEWDVSLYELAADPEAWYTLSASMKRRKETWQSTLVVLGED